VFQLCDVGIDSAAAQIIPQRAMEVIGAFSHHCLQRGQLRLPPFTGACTTGSEVLTVPSYQQLEVMSCR
jgi:hypothetical protein